MSAPDTSAAFDLRTTTKSALAMYADYEKAAKAVREATPDEWMGDAYEQALREYVRQVAKSDRSSARRVATGEEPPRLRVVGPKRDLKTGAPIPTVPRIAKFAPLYHAFLRQIESVQTPEGYSQKFVYELTLANVQQVVERRKKHIRDHQGALVVYGRLAERMEQEGVDLVADLSADGLAWVFSA